LTIGPFVQNTSTVHINLDGIKTVKGNINHDLGSHDFTYQETPFTVSSSTLTKVGGTVLFGDDVCNMLNFSMPSLTTVSGDFTMSFWCSNLTYLDITSLEFVQNLQIAGKSLTTLHNTKLSNATGLWIYDNLLDSVDSIFNNPLNITTGAEIDTLPNVKNVTIGFHSANSLYISDLSVILGGSSSTEMSLGNVTFYKLTGLQRNSNLKVLTADSVDTVPTSSMSQMDIPFDDLRQLSVREGTYSDLVTLRLPAKAANWTGGFALSVYMSPGLNLSSMYGLDDQGNQIQTWYWPTNVSSIDIYEAIVANEFLYV
jgi:hypothetical protein